MTFGERITTLRKQLKLSQDDLGKRIGTSAPIVGRYERNEIKPSIETAKKIADILNTTVDYLIGGADAVKLDKKMLQRIQDIQQLTDKDQEHIFALLDAFLRDYKTKKAYAS